MEQNKLMVLRKEFQGNNVDIIVDEKGELLFELYSTGMALGQVKVAKGKNYPHKQRIDKNIKNADISTVVRNAQQYLTENQLYDLMLEMKTDKVKPFRKWVTSDVLPNIRKHGGYVANDELFLNTYLPYADEQTKIFFKTTLSTIQNLNNEISVLKPKAEDYDLLTNKHNAFDMNSFAKILNISGLGRNNMFAYLRGQNILMTGVRENQPYQRYMQWFEVTTVYTPKGWKEKTLVKPQGVSGILKHLKKDGYVPTTLNPKDIIEQLEKEINTYDN